MIGRLSRVALRFARTHRGTYIAVTGEATRRVRYSIIRQSLHRWRAERADQVPGGGWVVSDVRTVETLRAAEEWCEDCARKDRALLPREAR
jgi:hypothetical protein